MRHCVNSATRQLEWFACLETRVRRTCSKAGVSAPPYGIYDTVYKGEGGSVAGQRYCGGSAQLSRYSATLILPEPAPYLPRRPSVVVPHATFTVYCFSITDGSQPPPHRLRELTTILPRSCAQNSVTANKRDGCSSSLATNAREVFGTINCSDTLYCCRLSIRSTA